MSTVETSKLQGDVLSLCRHLAGKGPTPVAGLPKQIAQPSVLAQALVHGLAEIGRRNYSQTILSTKVKKNKAGVVEFDDFKRAVVEREYQLHIDNDWSWSSLNRPGCKALTEVLAEDDDLPDPKVCLHVRLTTAGLAASAA